MELLSLTLLIFSLMNVATSATDAPHSPDHTRLDYWFNDEGIQRKVSTVEDWQHRRQHILKCFERVAGSLPSAVSRVPLKTKIFEEVRLDPPQVRRPLIRRKVRFHSDGNDEVPAYLFLPVTHDPNSTAKRPAVLCLQQTTDAGKDEPAGIRGDPTMKYALELAERGFVTLAPDYPSFGEHTYDFAAVRGYQSGSMKAVWDNMRAIDLLVALPEVDAERIGCIGHSLGGHNAVFTSIFEPRISTIVCSCGFTGLKYDDLPSWTGPRYFPRIATEFDNSAEQMPFDFHELIASLAPRPVLICAAEKDDDFDVKGVREVMQAAKTVYALHGAESQLQAVYPPVPHSFPDNIREKAYEFLETHLSDVEP
jgi:dienelactone hydrolase